VVNFAGAGPGAIQALTTEFYQPALVEEGTVEAVDPLDPKPVDQGRSFKELGFKDRPIRCLVPRLSH